MIGSEIAQEVAGRAAVMTSRVGTEANTEGIDRTVEEGARECWSGGRCVRFMRRSPEQDECAAPPRAHTAGRRLVG